MFSTIGKSEKYGLEDDDVHDALGYFRAKELLEELVKDLDKSLDKLYVQKR